MKVLWVALFASFALLTCVACSSSGPIATDADESVGSTSLAFSSAYQVTWSGNRTAPAGCPATCGTPPGSSTCICGGQSNACIGGPGWGDKDFTDTSPPNAVVTLVHLDIQQMGCGAGTVSAFLNGTPLGAYQPTSACACNGCDPPQTVTSARFPNGVPGYKYGGPNRLHLEAASGSPCIAQVDVRVDGTSARLGVTPGAFAFGNQGVGSTSAAQTFTVRNQGADALTVDSFDTSGPFTIAAGPRTPFTLAAGQAATVGVTFSPTDSGAATGSLTVASTDPRGPAVVQLSGTGVAPAVSTSPNPKDFGPLDIGANAMGVVTITNTGNDTLNVSNITVRGPNASDFTLVSPPASPSLQPGQRLPLTVRFAPSQHGVRTGEIAIASDAANAPTFASALTGSGRGPEMEIVSPSPIAFGGANVNTNAAPQKAIVRNAGDGPLRIASASFSNGEFGASSTFPIDIAPGARSEIALTFRPTAIGARTGNLVLTSNDSLNPAAKIALTGSGTSPTVNVTPASLEFGDVRTGTPPSEKTVTIANTGTGPLVVARAALGGRDASLFTLAPVSLPLTIAAGGRSVLTVRYAPTAVGANEGTLTVDSNDASHASVVVPLSGNGVSPSIALQPASLDFGAHLVGHPSSARTAEITNSGTAPLNITALTLGGAQGETFALSGAPALPAIVAPNATLSLSLAFTPAAMGDAAGELAIVSDDPNTPRALLTLTGTAVSQLLAVSPTTLDFGIVKVGAKTEAKTVSITNTGGDPIELTDGVLEGAQMAAFAITPFAGSLEPGQSASVSVTYLASAAADASATLKVGAADTTIPQAQVALHGRAVSHLLVSDVSSLDFGHVKVGDKSPPKQVTLTSQSGSALDIASVATDSGQFVLGGGPSQLPAGGSAAVTVSFQPTTAGDASGKIRVTLKDASTEEVAITVTGHADPAVSTPQTSAGGGDISGGGYGCRAAVRERPDDAPVAIGAIAALMCLAGVRRRRNR